MRSRASPAIATTAVVLLTFAGCNGSTGPDDPSSESSRTTKSTDVASAAAAKPEIGTCWRVPTASATDPDYWFDDSPQVPCTKPHTAETAAVITLTEPTIAEARESSDPCWDYVRQYVGVDESSWVPWGDDVAMPSKADVADGASWLRCDAVFPRTWSVGFTEVRTTSVTAEGLADEPPSDFLACLNEPPTRMQPFIPCDGPHAYEQTGTLALLEGLEQYPSAAELEAEGRKQCRKDVPPDHPNVAVTAAWDPPATLKHGTAMAGPCFMFSTDAQPLPARPNN